jgi:hypothetical protein
LLWFFLKLSLSILLFLILSTIVDFLMKHYRLLQFFPAWFFFIYFFVIFFKILFVDFILLILSGLRITIVYFLTKHYRLLQCFPKWSFNIKLIENLTLTFPTCFFLFAFCFLFFFSNLSSFSFHFFVLFFSELFLSIIFF